MSATDRAEDVLRAMRQRRSGFASVRGSRRLVFDGPRVPVLDKTGTLVGVSVTVRLFEGATEIPIDPHRVIINPPTVPRANLTYVDDPSGEVDKHGVRVQRRVVGLPSPEAALIEAVWDSVEATPSPSGWRR